LGGILYYVKILLRFSAISGSVLHIFRILIWVEFKYPIYFVSVVNGEIFPPPISQSARNSVPALDY